MKMSNTQGGNVWGYQAFLSNTEDSAPEGTVLKLFHKVNVFIDPSNIENCYHLRSDNNAPQKVIIKLSKRKHVYHVLKAKSSFKNADITKNEIPLNTPIFVNQSLCGYYSYGQSVRNFG